jgi:hypothetical protein
VFPRCWGNVAYAVWRAGDDRYGVWSPTWAMALLALGILCSVIGTKRADASLGLSPDDAVESQVPPK